MQKSKCKMTIQNLKFIKNLRRKFLIPKFCILIFDF